MCVHVYTRVRVWRGEGLVPWVLFPLTARALLPRSVPKEPVQSGVCAGRVCQAWPAAGTDVCAAVLPGVCGCDVRSLSPHTVSRNHSGPVSASFGIWICGSRDTSSTGCSGPPS